MNAIKRINTNVIVITLLMLLAFITLFICRMLDDNRLTSWQWVFNSVNITEIFLILLAGLIPAYIFSRVSFFERYPVICLFSLSYVIAALFWGEPEVIVDTSRYFTQAKYLDVYGMKGFIKEWGKDIYVWTDMPLMSFLYGLIFRFLGEARIYIQIFTTFLFAMTVVLTYLIGKELWSEEVGFFGGLFLLGMPYLLTQVPLMLVDIPTMFFLTLSVFTCIKALNRGGMWIGFSSIAIFLAFFSKYSTWPMLSVLVVIFVVYLITSGVQRSAFSVQRNTPNSKLETPNYIRRGVVITLISGLLIGIVFWYKFDVFSEQIKLLIDYQKPGLERWGESFISTFLFQVHPFITALALYSIYDAFKKKDLKYLIIIWLVFLVVLFQIRRIRYIIMAFPMLALMASYGLQAINDKRIVRFISFYIVIFSVIIAVFAYLPFLNNTSSANIKNAGAFLNSLDASEIEVFTLQAENPDVNPAVSVPILDLFTKKKIIYHYDKDFSPPPKDFEKSPLRFTWEYKNPEYYAVIPPNPPLLKGGRGDFQVKTAVIVIASDIEQSFPPYIEQRTKEYAKSKVFKISEGVFQYQTIVRVCYD